MKGSVYVPARSPVHMGFFRSIRLLRTGYWPLVTSYCILYIIFVNFHVIILSSNTICLGDDVHEKTAFSDVDLYFRGLLYRPQSGGNAGREFPLLDGHVAGEAGFDGVRKGCDE